MGIFGDRDKRENDQKETVKDGKLFLRKEELDVSKNKVQTGEVILNKNIVEEPKKVDVPVTHEEVVIERRAINLEPSDDPVGNEQIMRIPVNREFVNVDKHTVLTGEVRASKREVEDIEEIEEPLKREEVNVHSTGDTNIVSNEQDQLH